MYQNSGLRADNDAELDAAMTQRSTIRRATLAELAVQHATVTPFWWGLWIMLRVRLITSALLCASAHRCNCLISAMSSSQGPYCVAAPAGPLLNSKRCEIINDLVERVTLLPCCKTLRCSGPASDAQCAYVQYRTFKNYTSVQFLIPRVGDKLIFALLIFR